MTQDLPKLKTHPCCPRQEELGIEGMLEVGPVWHQTLKTPNHKHLLEERKDWLKKNIEEAAQ